MEYTIWVTGNCNLSCKYCYVEDMKNKINFSANYIPNLISFINKTYSYENIQINFFGGEPLLNFNVIKNIIDALEKKNIFDIEYYMTTNGLLLTDEILKYIANKGIKISLSWDGTKKVNDSNRIDKDGCGTYDRILSAYNMLIKYNIRGVRVRATFNSYTVDSLMQSIDNFCNVDNDISVIFVPDYFDNMWTEKKIEKVYECINIISKNKKYENISILGDKSLQKGRCNGGQGNYHIYADGKIYPCSFVVNKEQFIIGDLINGLDNKKISGLSENYYKNLSYCSGCDYEEYCLSYKCRYLNWSLTGDLNCASEVVCQFENLKMK